MIDRKTLALAYISEGNTCALVGEDKTLCSKQRGVAPLLAWLESGENCRNMFAADKVVGRAAAFLYVLLGVDEVYALVISESAEKVFQQFSIAYAYNEKVAAIRNRAGDGFCPMEQAVESIDEPAGALEAIRATVARLKQAKNKEKR